MNEYKYFYNVSNVFNKLSEVAYICKEQNAAQMWTSVIWLEILL